MIEKDNKYVLSSVDTALSVLDLFFYEEEYSATEIARKLNISRSTAFRFLVTLEKNGFVSKTAYQKYRLGIKVFTLGQLVHNRMELITLIHPHLINITSITGESSHLAIMDGPMHVSFIDKAVGYNCLKMDTSIGFRENAHMTATGKAMLAFEGAEFIRQYLKVTNFVQKTAYSIPDEKSLLDQLELIRLNGYSCDNEECELGLTCYAMPIIDAAGHPIAAISSSGPTTRINVNKSIHIDALLSATKAIQKLLK